MLAQQDLVYLGAFRLPADVAGSTNGFSFGGGPMAYRASTDSLYIGGHPDEALIAEVSIPAPLVINADPTQFVSAAFLQNFADPTSGALAALQAASGTAYLGGLLVENETLYGTVYLFYDANNVQRVSHYARSLDLDLPATPLRSVGAPESTGFVSGYLAEIPSAWQTALGGKAITGQFGIPIVSRTSWGPAAWAFDPSVLSGPDPVNATALVYYTADHATLGPWEGSNGVYGGTTSAGGLALVKGAGLFVGANGTGAFCYGPGTDDPALAGTDDGEGGQYCYDPTNSDKGQHAYPYNYQLWAYDLNDWAAVKAGSKQPWEVTPYGVWPLTLPTSGAWAIGGVAFDAIGQRLFVSQRQADPDGFAYRPLIHVFHIA